MTIAWVHGCIGLYLWLRMRAFYKRAAPFLLAAARKGDPRAAALTRSSP
jgi:hypothetical protein